jgi:preprotein translocase subunit SecA
MFGALKKYFDYNEKEMARIGKIVQKIRDLEDEIRSLEDSQFREKIAEMRISVQNEEKTLDDVLPYTYALVREASRRILHMRHFDVQLLAGVALHEGSIVEQKTGEGKTLTATLPLVLNALAGKGTHLVTVNDYLAQRDAGWMGHIYDFLGLSTSVLISQESYLYDSTYEDADTTDWRLSHLRQVTRKEAYQADITYGINSEFGFDYLRDNMVTKASQMVQRGFYYAIVDEADSVLIDEARTPHIISAPYEDDVSKYYKYAQIVRKLKREEDFVVDEKLRAAHLTDEGIEKIEQALGVENIYEKDFDTLFYIEAAVKAQALFENNKEYIVKDGEVVIVDEFTGRLLHGRRFSEGIHQAIEAKENVTIKKESRTLATVSLQNYFRGYDKLAGMTGTAVTEAEEFDKIYKTPVLAVPTNRPITRKDHSDMIYKTHAGKFNAIADMIATQHKNGRPVLVGTTSIEKNELLSSLLKKRGIPHEVLNAKNHLREAQIIADAGKKGSVTVATNMAGRGVDIVLGGEKPSETDFNGDEKKYQKAMQDWQNSHDEVIENGGLYVIGTERHESRRIDNQLRGRSGRQGDPGDTLFFVSLEDDLMRIFGGDQISKLMTMFQLPEDQPLSHPMVSKAIEQSQIKVEGHNFDMRKHLVEYDDVLNKQRDIVYADRRKILSLLEEDPEKFETFVFDRVEDVVKTMVTSYMTLRGTMTEEDKQASQRDFEVLLAADTQSLDSWIDDETHEEVEQYVLEKARSTYDAKKDEIGEKPWLQIVRSVFLQVYDQHWTQHLTAIADLREGINLRGYAQLNPLNEYKNEAYKMFEQLLNDIQYEAVRRMMHIQVQKVDQVAEEKEKKQPQLQFHSASGTNPYGSEAKPTAQPAARSGSQPRPAAVSHPKIGRNDPCWCGSGKKYKKCHYPN